MTMGDATSDGTVRDPANARLRTPAGTTMTIVDDAPPVIYIIHGRLFGAEMRNRIPTIAKFTSVDEPP